MTQIFEVDISGVDTPEEREIIHAKVTKSLRGPLRFLKKPKRLNVHYRKHEKEGKRHLYELEFKLECEYGILNVESKEWDLLNAVDSGLNDLETIARKEKDKATH